MTDEQIIEIYKAAKEVFCNGIYVPVKDWHLCGWDFISFEYCDDGILDWIFEDGDISNGIYSFHPYENMTLKQILNETNGKFAFEIGMIDWC